MVHNVACFGALCLPYSNGEVVEGLRGRGGGYFMVVPA